MSWVSKALGLDKNKKLGNVINDALHTMIRRFLEDNKAKYLAAMQKVGVSSFVAMAGWNALMAELD